VLDSRGEANIWLSSANYKFKLTDANGTEIWTVDNIAAPSTALSPVFSSNVTISANTSGPALLITQTGAGAAIRVQDSADPDASPFVVDTDGNVGIGTATPANALDIAGGAIQISTSGGTARTVMSADATDSIFSVNDDRNFTVKTNAATRLTINSTDATSTVPVVLPGVPTTALQAATKSYVDTVTPPGSLMAYAASSAPSGWLLCDGSAVSRTTYAALFAVISTTWGAGDGSTTFNVPDLRGQFLRGFDDRATATSKDTTTFTGTTTNGSATISSISATVTAYLYAGQPISGTGIPSGATIATVSSTSITISANATASGTVTITVGRTFASAQDDFYENHSHTATQVAHTHTISCVDNADGGGSYYPGTNGIIQTNTTSSAQPAITVATSTTGNVETRPKNYAVLYIIKT
jgi:microcystin-dependent protein